MSICGPRRPGIRSCTSWTGWTTKPGLRKRKGTSDVSGNAPRGPHASWDCESRQWLAASGMSADLFGQSEPFSGRWPTSGMTRSGRCYLPPTPAPRTAANVSSSSPGLLPTPAAGSFNDGESPESWQARNEQLRAQGINGNGMGTPLAIAVKQLLPTPRPQTHSGGAAPDSPGRVRSKDNPDGHSPNLATAVTLLKTPTAQLAVNGGSQHPDKRKAGGHGPTLADQVEHLLPTPTARDWKSGQSNIMDRNARPLNEVVEMLLPTPLAWGSRPPAARP